MNERNFTEQLKHHRNLDERGDAAILISNEKGDVEYSSKKCGELFGYTTEEMKAQSVKSLVHPGDVRRIEELHNKYIQGMSIPSRYEFNGVRKDGHIVHLEAFAFAAEKNKRVCLWIWDVTERKKAEEELVKNERKYRSLIENLNIGVYRATPGAEGSFIDINQAFAEILGYENNEEVMRLKVSDIYLNPTDRKKFNDKVFTEGLVRNEELLLKRKDGAPIIASDTATAVYSDNGELMYIDGILEDISEQKESERDLRIRDCAMGSSINAIAIADLEGKLTYVNPSFLEMWGYDDEKQVLGKPGLEFWHDEKQAAESLRALVETGGWIGEMVGKRKDGSLFNVQLSMSLGKDNNGNPVCMMGSFVDITERKMAEEAVRQRNRELAILNAISAVVSQSLNIDEILEAALDRLLKLMNLDIGGIYLADPEDHKLDLVIHRGVSEEFAHELRSIQVDKETLETVIARGKLRKFILSARAILKNQRELRRALSAMEKEGLNLDFGILTLLQAQENILGLLILGSREFRQFSKAEQQLLVSISHQIAVAIENSRLYKASQQELEIRKKTEEALRESEEKLRYLFENARDIILTSDLEGNITSVNKVIAEHGFKKDEFIGKNLLSFAQKKYWPRMLKELRSIAEGNPVEGEILLITPKGERIVEYRTNPINKGGEVVGLQTILRDITDHKYAEKKLKEYSKKLENMVEERTRKLREAQEELVRKEKLATLGQLAGSVGHELRSPLGVISNSVYFLRMKLEGSDEKIKKHLDIIERNIQRANKIISDLLGFSGTKELVQVESNVNDIIKCTLADIKVPENISVRIQFDDKNVKIPLDSDRMQRVFLNLITNAVEAMPEGGNLDIVAEVKDSFMYILFRDTGNGISADDLQKIFEPLYTTKSKGIGLGLTIARSIVEEHKGTMEVESGIGIGTTLTIKLPLQN